MIINIMFTIAYITCKRNIRKNVKTKLHPGVGENSLMLSFLPRLSREKSKCH